MKKIILILSMLMSFLGISQVGKVGVNTIAPTRELDVNGGLRVRKLLDKSIDPTYSNIFATDANGNVDYVTKVALSKDLNSANGEQNEPWYNAATRTGATSNTQNIYQNGNVGIGVSNPTLALEVNGSSKVKKSFVTQMNNVDNTNSNNFTAVALNNTTGELVKFTNRNNSKPFSHVTFIVNTVSGEDYVRNFNTRIPTSEYTVLLVNAIFNEGKLSLHNGRTSSFVYRSFQENGTWRLEADYRDVAPEIGRSYSWTLVCLVIQNAQIKDLGVFTRSLNRDHQGDVGALIPGL